VRFWIVNAPNGSIDPVPERASSLQPKSVWGFTKTSDDHDSVRRRLASANPARSIIWIISEGGCTKVRNGFPRQRRNAFSIQTQSPTYQRSLADARRYEAVSKCSSRRAGPLSTKLLQLLRDLLFVEVPVGGIAECAARASHRGLLPLDYSCPGFLAIVSQSPLLWPGLGNAINETAARLPA
jgi:hypothetical protein